MNCRSDQPLVQGCGPFGKPVRYAIDRQLVILDADLDGLAIMDAPFQQETGQREL